MKLRRYKIDHLDFYSPTNPFGFLGAFEDGSPGAIALRGDVVVALATRRARFLNAVGGEFGARTEPVIPQWGGSVDELLADPNHADCTILGGRQVDREFEAQEVLRPGPSA